MGFNINLSRSERESVFKLMMMMIFIYTTVRKIYIYGFWWAVWSNVNELWWMVHMWWAYAGIYCMCLWLWLWFYGQLWMMFWVTEGHCLLWCYSSWL